jgi:hypothetical protein
MAGFPRVKHRVAANQSLFRRIDDLFIRVILLNSKNQLPQF